MPHRHPPSLPVAAARLTLAVGVAVLTAVAGAARGETPHDVLTAGQTVTGIGTASSLTLTACLGADGRIGAEVIGRDGRHALACVDADGATALARQGDPSPRGGTFVNFDACALLPDGSVYFSAIREASNGDRSRDIYRADAGGIRTVVGGGDVASDGTLLQSIIGIVASTLPGMTVFEVNDRGTVLARVQTVTGPMTVRVRPGEAPESLRAVANTGRPWIYGNRLDVALAPDDTVVALATLPGGEPAIVALENPEARVLFPMSAIAAQLGLVDTINHGFFELRLGGDVFAFHLEYWDAGREWRREWVRYSPSRGFSLVRAAGAYDQAVVIDISPAGQTLAVGYTYDDDVPNDYLVITDAGAEIIGHDGTPYAFPNALAINDRGNILLQTPGADYTMRRRLALTGPPPDLAAQCGVPPTAVPPTPAATATETPIPTPPPTRTSIPTPDCGTQSSTCAHLRVGSADGAPGDVVNVAVTLEAPNHALAGIQADLRLLAQAPVVRNGDGTPACRVDPAARKVDGRFAFQPFGCTDDCTDVRALVLSFTDVDPIPGRARLFTCRLRIDSAAAEGVYPLTLSTAAASDPHGGAFPIDADAGALRVYAAGDRASSGGASGSGGGCQIDPITSSIRPLLLSALALLTMRLRGARRG